MQILLSCAKTMAENNPAEIPRTTLPRYAREAAELALQLATLSTEELERMLRTNRQIAATTRPALPAVPRRRGPPALLAYTGVVFRHIAPERFTPGDFEYAQQHLNITSFLYGCSGRWTQSPLPAGRGRRIAGARRPNDVRVLAGTADRSLPRKNPCRRRHSLVNLASSEMKRLFDWKRIRRERVSSRPNSSSARATV